MQQLLHFSEDPNIEIFRPHVPASSPGDPLMVWGARSDALFGLVRTMQRGLDGVGALRLPTLYLYGAHDPIIPRGAVRRAVRALPAGVRTVCYRDGWHLLTRDLEGPLVWRDVLEFIRDPVRPPPSGAPPIAVAGKSACAG